MEARTETKPLDRFPIIRTDDVDETKEAFQGFYGELYLSVFRDFDKYRAYGNHCQLNDIGISYMSYSAPVRESYPNFTPGYAIRLQSPVRDGAKRRTRHSQLPERRH